MDSICVVGTPDMKPKWPPRTPPMDLNCSFRTPGKNSVLHKSNKHFRYENILFKGENVLTPKTLQQVGPTEFFWGEPLKLSTIVPDVPGARRDVDLSN